MCSHHSRKYRCDVWALVWILFAVATGALLVSLIFIERRARQNADLVIAAYFFDEIAMIRRDVGIHPTPMRNKPAIAPKREFTFFNYLDSPDGADDEDDNNNAPSNAKQD